MTKKPNILFLFVDDMQHNAINALGNSEVITPNLDELMENGVCFTHAHIPGGTFGAVCMPSRAMLHSGRSLYHIDGLGEEIPDEHTTIGEHLLANGYNSFGTGKWHNGHKSFARSFNAGSDIFFGGMYDHWKVPVYNYDPTGEYSRTVKDVMNPAFNDPQTTDRRMDHCHWGEHSTDLFVESACEYLREYDSDKPFFLYLSYLAPHDPRSMPEKYLNMYDINNITLPPNAYPVHPFDFGVFPIRDEVLTDVPRDPEVTRKEILSYYAMITHLDESVGRVIETLKQQGMYEDTIIIFSGDNGLAIGQHGLFGKQNAYEHSIRVPLIMSGPGIPKNQRRDCYLYLLDIFPTICEYAGLEVPTSVEGIGFKKVVDDPSKETRDLIFSTYADKVRSIKDKRYKILQYKCRDLRKTQLFDLVNDPWEMNDLSGEKEMQPIIHDLRAKLKQYAEDWDDQKSPEGNRYWTEYLQVENDTFGW